MNHYVYEITNLINGKKYIGKRSCKCKIEDDKYMGSGTLLKKAFDKYGIENFSKKIILICKTEEEAYREEINEIYKTDATNNPMYYNIRRGGFGFTSEDAKKIWLVPENRNKFIKLTKERWQDSIYRKKMTERAKGNKYGLGYKHTEEHKKHMSELMKGKTFSDETKKKISESNKGKIPWNKGVPMTEEQKKVLSKLAEKRYDNKENHPMYGKKHNPNTIRLLRNINLGKKQSEETKRLKSIQSKKMWENEQFKIKMSEMRKGKGVGGNNGFAKKVICLNNNMIFDCIKDAKEYIGLKSQSGIGACCKGKGNSSGKINGEPARWMYYEDYLKINHKSNIEGNK